MSAQEHSGSLSMKVVFPGEKMTSEALVEHVRASQTILTGFNLLATTDDRDYSDRTPRELALLSQNLIRNATTEASMAPVWRVSFNSPLEILLGIGLSTAVLSVSANRVIGTFERILGLRRDIADTDLHVMRVEILQESLASLRAASDPVMTLDIDRLVNEVSNALNTVSEVQIIDDSVG